MPDDPASHSESPLRQQLDYFHKRLDELTGQAIKSDALNSRNTRELRQRRQALSILSDLQRAISTDMPPREIYARIIAAVQQSLKMDRTVILERGEGDSFKPAAWAGFDAAGEAKLATAVVTISPDMQAPNAAMLAAKSAPETPLMRELRDRLMLPLFVLSPVIEGGKAVAMVMTGRSREAKPFFPPLDEGDVNTVQSLAGFLGAALHNAALFAHQKRMADSFARFVPVQFLRFLGRQGIVDVQLGDQIQRVMSILFSDIRSFTTISEKMTPKENFDFINRYLEIVAPAVLENGGFIDKFIGDAIMALFPGEADQAVAAAVGLQKGVAKFNAGWTALGRQPIAIGAGIHTGSLMLGTIGYRDRMESTVISDSVNLASRMEGLTKMYGAGVVISGSTLAAMKDPGAFQMRQIDRVKVKGKKDPVDVIEIIDGESPEIKDLKAATAPQFNAAFAAYRVGDLRDARTGFEAILARNSTDEAARLLRDRCAEYLRVGKGAEWAGVEKLDHK